MGVRKDLESNASRVRTLSLNFDNMWNQNNLSQLSHSGTGAVAANRFSRPRIDIHPTSHFPSTEERKASQLSKQATATPVDTVPFPTVSGSFDRSSKYHRTVAGPKTVVEPSSDRHGLLRDHEPHGDKECHRDVHEEDTTGLSIWDRKGPPQAHQGIRDLVESIAVSK